MTTTPTVPTITAVDDPPAPILVLDAGAVTFHEHTFPTDSTLDPTGDLSETIVYFPEVSRYPEPQATDITEGTYNVVWVREDPDMPMRALLDVIRHRADHVIVRRLTPAWDHAQRAAHQQNLLEVTYDQLRTASDTGHQGNWDACRQALIAAAATILAEIDRVDVAIERLAQAIDPDSTLSSTDRLNTMLTPIDFPQHPNRKRLRTEGVTYEEIVARDKGRCRYCGVKTTTAPSVTGFDRMTFDVVDPDAPQGLANIATACWRCNVRKGDRTPDEAGMTLLDPPTDTEVPQ